MEARASFSGTSVPKIFVAAVLVIVAMGLAAMGGYVARGLSSGAAATQSQTTVHAAPGTVLRQDNPAKAGTELPAGAYLPSYIHQETDVKPTPRILQDDPYFIQQYGNATIVAAASDNSKARKFGHQEQL